MLSLGPPVKSAFSIDAKDTFPYPGDVSERFVRVKSLSAVRAKVSIPVELPVRLATPAQPVTSKVCPPVPELVSTAFMIPERTKLPVESTSEVSERLKSESLEATTVPEPPPFKTPPPLQPLTLNVCFVVVAPFRLACSIETRLMVPIPVQTSALSVSVKLVFRVLTTVSAPVRLPVSVPTPVHPLTSNVCPEEPVFVNRTVPNPENEIAPRPAASVYVSDVFVRVKPASFDETIVSEPPPPVNFAEPLQPLTSNVLLLGPPVKVADSIPFNAHDATCVPWNVPIRVVSLRVKSASRDRTTVSLTPWPVSVPAPVQPVTLKV